MTKDITNEVMNRIFNTNLYYFSTFYTHYNLALLAGFNAIQLIYLVWL